MITVMMPCRNNIKYLQQSIDSILSQTYTDFDLIIINDCSTEPVSDILNKYNDNRIIILENDKQMGVPYTLNRILDASRGEYFCRQDNDDISAPDRLYEQVKMLESGYDFVSCRIGSIDSNGNESHNSWVKAVNKTGVDHIKSNIGNSNFLAGGSTMWTRSVFDKIGYFDPKLRVGQDYNYWIRILKYFDICIVEKVLYFHRQHDGSHRRYTNTYRDENNRVVDYHKLSQTRAINNPIIKSYT